MIPGYLKQLDLPCVGKVRFERSGAGDISSEMYERNEKTNNRPKRYRPKRWS